MIIDNKIEELYCSLEVSSLLKQKGFDVKYSAQYWERNDDGKVFLITPFEEEYRILNHEDADIDDMSLKCLAPTQSVAKEWIRKNLKFNIWVERYSNSERFYWQCPELNDIENKLNHWADSEKDATDNAIIHVLELIS